VLTARNLRRTVSKILNKKITLNAFII